MIYIIKKESSYIYRKNKSKFIGYSFKINSVSNIKKKIIELKRRHKKRIISAMLVKQKKNHISQMTENLEALRESQYKIKYIQKR